MYVSTYNLTNFAFVFSNSELENANLRILFELTLMVQYLIGILAIYFKITDLICVWTLF